jgi:hypothetical protein
MVASMRRPPSFRRFVSLIAAGVALWTASARATPLDFIPVGDPLEDELRVLEVQGAPLRVPRFESRPLQVSDLPPLSDSLGRATHIARERLLRSLVRDRGDAEGVPGVTPRLVQLVYPADQRLELSAAVEGGGTFARGQDPQLVSGSGVHVRVGLQLGRWLAHVHAIVGNVEGSERFAQHVLPGTHAVLYTDDSYVAYTGASERWDAWLGRGRVHWGPGDEGSLLLSKTSLPLTALVFHARIEPLHADATILNATLGETAGEQLAAHRLEWQPTASLRLGIAEAARYHSTRWAPLYLIGVLPYSLVQNLMVQDEPDSVASLRNNVMLAFDAAWRFLPGSRAYAELLIDDLKTDTSSIVSKYGYQLGWEGVGTVRGSRVTWGVEFTRLTRFVYTSFFGQSFEVNGVPLGYPTGPDSRRVRVRGDWDPSASWQVFGSASRTDLGESGLDVPFVPGGPLVDVTEFAGVVQSTREFEVGLRYWPSSGLDLAAAVGYRWIDNQDHQTGENRADPTARVSVRWVR